MKQEEEEEKRDFLREKTVANSMLLKDKCGGSFEAVLTNNGNEKCLIPQVGTLHFLYRGQNKEFIPCVPSLYRGNPSEAEIFIERMKLVVFKRLLETHPVINHFFKKHNFKIDIEGLAQHYGLKTSVLDLTSNIDIALFFATCWYDNKNDQYNYYNDNEIHEALLYLFIPILDNEPCPSLNDDNYLNHNIRPIGLQAFPRPGVQEGYGLHIPKNESIKSYIYRFTFTSKDSKEYYDKYKKGELLWVKDALIEKTKQISNMTYFSFHTFNEAFKNYRPKGYSATKLKKDLKKFIILQTASDAVTFSHEEQMDIVDNWNSSVGAEFVSKIFRKAWFEYDDVDTNTGEILGKRNEHQYRTLTKISQIQWLVFVGCPDNLEGAEWVNYTNKPRPKEKINANIGQCIKVPGSMEEWFGKPYLTTEDWFIQL